MFGGLFKPPFSLASAVAASCAGKSAPPSDTLSRLRGRTNGASAHISDGINISFSCSGETITIVELSKFGTEKHGDPDGSSGFRANISCPA